MRSRHLALIRSLVIGMDHLKRSPFPPHPRVPWALIGFLPALLFLAMVGGCEKKVATKARPPAEVSVMKAEARDTSVTIEFVGQTQSSHQVEIRARVNGFLDDRAYTEGSIVKAGQVMFKMDPKPFQAQLDAARGALGEQQARLQTAQANLKRIRPLAQQNAVSQKDLDDAIGQEQAAAAAVESAKANLEEARLNLSYTTIASPVAGASSYARVQDGAYVNQQNSLLTYVAQTDPIWVNFSMSENDVLKYRGDEKRSLLRAPKNSAFELEVMLADGSMYPWKGRITFADAEYSQQTGTFLVRGTLPNPDARLRPGTVRARACLGRYAPQRNPRARSRRCSKARRAISCGLSTRTARPRSGMWKWAPGKGDQWFIDSGLSTGDTVVVDGAMKVSAGSPVKIVDAASAPQAAAAKESQP